MKLYLGALLSVAFGTGVALGQPSPDPEHEPAGTAPETESEPEPPPPPDAAALMHGMSSDPAHARGWETPPEPPSRGVFGWIGRVIAYPGYLVSTALFAPARGLIYLEAHHHTLSDIKEFFYNDAGTAGVLPVVAFASGVGLSFGAKVFHGDVFGHKENIVLRAAYGFAVGREVQLKIELPHLAGDRLYVFARGRYEKRNNLLFQGIGNPAPGMGSDLDPRAAAVETRYQERRYLGLISGGAVFHPGGYRLTTGASLIGNDRLFGATVESGLGTSLGDVYDTSLITGFDDGIDQLEVTGDVGFDTRPNSGPDHSGISANGFAGGPVVGAGVSYFHYGAELATYWQPWWPRRTIVFRVAHEAVRGDDDKIPFTELPRLGGAGLLRGYSRDRFRDRLAGVVSAEYHYPIHENLSGQFFVEAGKVGASYDELVGDGLSDNWNVGYGGGLLVHSRDGVKIRIDVAYGDGLALYFATDVLEAFNRRGKEL